MKKNLMNIVLAANDGYMEHLAVTLVSILVNANKSDSFKFYILSNDITERSKENLLRLKFFKNFEIEFLKIPEEDFAMLPENFHLKKQAYYRLKIPKLISEEKALYLDCDIIVRKSLAELYSKDISNVYAAVIEDIKFGKSTNNTEMLELHNISNYFNSGVMLLNLDKLRQESVMESCLDFCIKNPEKLFYCDQDALNCVMDKFCLFLEPKFNFQYQPYHKPIKELYKNCKKDIVLTHFVSDQKPWDLKPTLKFGLEYYHYAILTPWKYKAAKNFLRLNLKTLKNNFLKTILCLKHYI